MTKKSKIKFGIILFLILVLLIIGFALGVKNSQVVTFNYLIAQTEISLSHLIAILFGCGLLLGWLFTSYFYMKVRLKNISLNRQLAKLQDIKHQINQNL